MESASATAVLLDAVRTNRCKAAVAPNVHLRRAWERGRALRPPARSARRALSCSGAIARTLSRGAPALCGRVLAGRRYSMTVEDSGGRFCYMNIVGTARRERPNLPPRPED